MDKDRLSIGACVAISLAAHLLAAAMLSSQPKGEISHDGSSESRQNSDSMRGKVSPEGSPSEFLAKAGSPIHARLDISPSPKEPQASKDAHAHPQSDIALGGCKPSDKSYQGVGISFLNFSGQIQEAPANYPGYKAGLRVGDTVDNPREQPIDGHLAVKIRRRGKPLSFRIKSETICYSEKANGSGQEFKFRPRPS